MFRQIKESAGLGLMVIAVCLVFSGCDDQGFENVPEDRWLDKSQSQMPAETGYESAGTGGKRYCSAIVLNPDKVEEFRKLHKDIPPDVQQALHEHKIRNYSVYLRLIDDQYYVIRYYEYLGTEHEVDVAALARNPAFQKWRDAYEACQVTLLPLASGDWWAFLEEIGHID